MTYDEIEILAADQTRLHGENAFVVVDEIIRRHAADEAWDEVKRWNRVRLRIKRRSPGLIDNLSAPRAAQS